MKRTGLIFLVAALAMLASLAGVGCAGTESLDYDVDDDGLIEMSRLGQLNAIRWDLDGDGEADDSENADAYAAAFPDAVEGMGCPDGGCAGYELTRSLDFAAGASYALGAVNSEWTQGSGWMPIGSHAEPFLGTLDGGGNTIANLFIDRPEDNHVGLFGESNGEIRGLGVVNANIKGSNTLGVMAGTNNGAIVDSYVTGEVEGRVRDAGGMVSINAGSISGSYADAAVSGVVNIAGGLVAVNYGEIRDSYATGNVSCSGRVAGGLAALSFGEVSGSYATGDVAGNDLVGGLVGLNQGPITGSYATGVVAGQGDDIGGLAGVNYRPITNSYSEAKVTGRHRIGGLVGINRNNGEIVASYAEGMVSGDIGAGGLAGWNDGKINGSYASSAVTGEDDIGGLVGKNNGPVTVSYATGRVSASHRVGGLVGDNNNAGTISSSYSSSEVLGSDDVGGLVGENQGAIRGSYAQGDVSGERDTGGLVGENLLSEDAGSIVASYATGNVRGMIRVGGLVGWNNGPISTSYAAGGVFGEISGGLIGENENTDTINAVYWDTQTTGQAGAVGFGPSAGTEGKTTAELQSPIGYTGIYATWNQGSDFWNFISPGHYPALKADFDGDGTATSQEFGGQ